MDTSKLVVGQKVWMQSGNVFKDATVTEITDEYVEVTPVFKPNERPWMIHFQKDGKQFIVRSNADIQRIGNLGVYDWCCGAWGRFDPRPERGDGGYLWELTDAEGGNGFWRLKYDHRLHNA